YIDDYGLFGADGRGKTDVGFVGNDWSHLHVDDLKEVCKKRLVDWMVDPKGLQVAIVLTALHESAESVAREEAELRATALAAHVARLEQAARAARDARGTQDHPLLGLVMIVKDEAARIAS